MNLPETASTDKEGPREVQKFNSTRIRSAIVNWVRYEFIRLNHGLTADRSEQSADQTPSTDSKTKSLVDVFIRQAVGSRKTLSRAARQDELIASVDDIIAQKMRNLLPHPQFQALKSLWRSVYFVVKPCAEIPLTDSGASKMIAQGLIPLWSVKNADRIHSGDVHSISE